MTKAQPGKLIVFEGIDGTGKSTQIGLLANHLTAQGIPVVTTREPTTGRYGQQIRQLYHNRNLASREEELELFIADRREHVEQLLLPSLEAGKIVLCDRYYLSTAAYQGANGFDPAEILQRNGFAPEPDLAIIFELPIDVCIERITGTRGDALNQFEQAETLTEVSRLFAAMNLPCIRRVSADQPIAAVHEQILTLIEPLLYDYAAEPLEQP